MRILVTGASGQLARSLAALDESQPGLAIVVHGRPELDLENPDIIGSLISHVRPDVVVNAAAYTAVDAAERDNTRAFAVNAAGAGAVAAAAAAVGLPVIHISTDYVFAGGEVRPYREDDPTGPVGAYGRSKLIGERLVAERCENSVILRTAWIYSPFGANFVRTMLRLNETREEVGVVADQVGNPTSALDIADALLAIAARVRDDSSPGSRGVSARPGGG